MMVVELSHYAAIIFGAILELVGVKRQLNSEPPTMLGKFWPTRKISVPPVAGAASGTTCYIIGSL